MAESARAFQQDEPSLQTPEQERARIMMEQRIEGAWWGQRQKFSDASEIAHAVEQGVLTRVPDEGNGYKISANVQEGYRVLERTTAQLLEDFAAAWKAEMELRGITRERVFLVISSLTRPTEYQQELVRQGKYPAAEDSSHERGLAFDIAVAWFRKNDPEVAGALEDVAREFRANGSANVIDETTVGCIHVCPSPRYAAEVTRRGIRAVPEEEDIAQVA